MFKLIKKIYMYFEEKRNWNAKMSESLKAKVISNEKGECYEYGKK